LWSWAPSGYMRLLADELSGQGIQGAALIVLEKIKTGEMRGLLDESVLAKNPDLVIIVPGSADYNPWEKPTVPEEFKENLTAIVGKLRAADIRTVLVTSYPVPTNLTLGLHGNVSEFNSFIRDLARTQGTGLVDFARVLDEEEPLVPLDGSPVAKALVNQMFAGELLRSMGSSEAEVAACRTAWLDKPGTIELPPLLSVNTFEKLKLQTGADDSDMNAYLTSLLEENISRSSP